MSDPNDYTVAWICAITTEYVAAQAMLDERHQGPASVATHDNNDYTLGSIGQHKVVMAVLPPGEYGIASAAAVARDLLHSFANVRVGLMVGIGGGAPSPKHDIRLGDIVVSTSGGGQGGVFQYDFGRAVQDGEFQETGFLNQPPQLLRTAVGGLKAQYIGDGHQLQETVHSLIDKKPRLRKTYSRPGPSTDRLYKPGVLHPQDDESDCATTCGDDPSNLVPRHERTEDEDNPAIHYGLIASANRLMGDASIRDSLAASRQVLCFEMEAAGLMNHFPCLVIRGICDYSDTHINKRWQGYAAMTAAAYAKDLLRRIPRNKIEAERKLGEVLDGLQQGVGHLVRRQRHRDSEAVLEWLTPVDYAPQQSDYHGRRQPGTGQWLLDSPQYLEWLGTKGQTLFCPGIPGAGKTILTSIVIDNLHRKFDKTDVGVCYVYCNFRRQAEQGITDLLASLLKQLAENQPVLPEGVMDLYTRHKARRTRPSMDEVRQALHSLTVNMSSTRLFIVIDALDECHASNGSRLRFLEAVFQVQATSGANVFATSRNIPEITDMFQKCISLEIYASDHDVRRYLDGHMDRLPSFVRRNRELQEEVKTGIVVAVKGMFLLAQLHLDALIGKKSPYAVRIALDNLYSGSNAYDYAYRDAMKRIQGQVADQKVLAMDVISWITYAKRPLTTPELQHALATEVGHQDLVRDNISDVEDMVSACAGLVTVDKESDIVRLVHYTTQQYFEREQKTWFPNAESTMTTTCVTYLSFSVFESGPCRTDEELNDRLRLYQFYHYAASRWGDHARASSTLPQGVLDFLKCSSKAGGSHQANYPGHIHLPRPGSCRHRGTTGLHLAANWGLSEAAYLLIESGHDLDSRDHNCDKPLYLASRRGHEAVVRLLLEKGADIKSTEHDVDMLLSLAAGRGHEGVTRLLLDRGADIESTQDHRPPLCCAAANGHEAVVQLLLDRGADVEANSSQKCWSTPLCYAAKGGHAAVARLLLDNGANVEPRSINYQTPLFWAAERGHEAIM
ncbi:Pfs, NACHT and Ankyrin domain protein [Ophiocordyceps sinensis CO18]|uniref:Pfs, NACHT and Ankyrin domain protein n=1 Tax=Ophiocordyceps sinensis (strain Co18 / CGMCC 3.14243) TaxID=911162 RepID=T5AF42_OPHSC|nr:Pfs, NACHT and Ankyrin domain protein [Ophiocordyceps sinensis CO18]